MASELPSGAIQYHDLDLDILNLENADENTSTLDGKSSGQLIEDQIVEMQNGELEIKEYSKDGILDEATVEMGLSNLGQTADGFTFAYLHLKVAGYQLVQIDMLAHFTQLQVVDLSYNKLEDISILNSLPHLVEVRAAHNSLTLFPDLTPPNLRHLDLSFNQISIIPDLSAHRHLISLILDHNQIDKIQGLNGCCRLRHLSLAHNSIATIEGLNDIGLNELDLSFNQIQRIEGLESVPRLLKLSLAGNSLRSIKGLERCEALEVLDVEGNQILDIMELTHIKKLRLLHVLQLTNNPVHEIVEYRLLVVFELPALTELDHCKVDVDEKVSAQNQLNPSMEISAARDHRLNTVYQFFQPHSVLNSTLQNPDTPYPMLVLTGPQGSGKKDLAMRLVQDFPDFFGYAVSHTTRRPRTGEENGKDYFFVSLEEFENLQVKGKFIQTAIIQNDLYGLTQESIENVARDGLACVVPLEIEGVLAIKMSALEPRYVLTMPLNRTSHETYLRQRPEPLPEPEINAVVARSQIYVHYNRQRPGFFDMFINTDDLVVAYYRLRRLVMDYLGLSSIEDGGILMDQDSANPTSHGEMESAPGNRMRQKSPEKGFSRTWSKNSLPMSASQKASGTSTKPFSSKNISPVAAARGEVERDSMIRRQSAAKNVVAGVRPNPYATLPVSAPYSSQAPGLARPGNTGPGKPVRDSDSMGSRSNISQLSWNNIETGPEYTFRDTGGEFQLGVSSQNSNQNGSHQNSRPQSHQIEVGAEY